MNLRFACPSASAALAKPPLQSETQIHHLLTFCEPPFDPACLVPHRTRREVLSTASAAQVREPIRTDTAHSAPYLAWLQPLRERLGRRNEQGRRLPGGLVRFCISFPHAAARDGMSWEGVA